MEIQSYRRLASHLTTGLPLFVKMNFGDYKKVSNRRLRYMVRHAYENVEMYRRKYDEAGVKPGDIRGTDDLDRLPLITKKDLVDNYPGGILAQGFKPEEYYIASTSGSTGVPVRVFKNMGILSTLMAGSVLMNKMAGTYLGMNIKPDSSMYIFVDAPDSLEGVIVAEKTKLPSRFIKQNPHLDALAPPEQHIDGINDYKPDILVTYPSVLRNIAVLAEQLHLPLHQPQVLMVSGELLDENTRAMIKRSFTGELLNFYAATECGVVAIECKYHTGMHIKAGSTILELVRNEKIVPSGQTGEIVVTDLWNEATPIIRYAGLSDVGVFSTERCRCGLKTPRLKVIEGRMSDSIVLKNNVIIHPFSMTLALEHISGIARFQIVQEEIGLVRALIVPGKNGTAEQADIIESHLKEVLGDGVRVEVVFVQDIPRLPNGQNHRVVISKIAHPVLV
jgi:phenylacetate-CoA ligase